MARTQHENRATPENGLTAKLDAVQSSVVWVTPTRAIGTRGFQIFQMISNMRPLDLWSPYDLHIMTDLAALNTRIEALERELVEGGDMVETPPKSGVFVVNPRAAHIGNLRRQSVVLMRALGLTAGQRNLGEEGARKRMGKAKELHKASIDADGEPLLA